MRAPLLAIVLAALTACASIPTQSKYMEEHGVTASAEALRMRLRAEAIPFTGLMAQAADAASESSTDPAVHRRALVWKINVVPALYRTLFNQRPMLALVDTWALLLQAEAYLESSEGRQAFGPGGGEVLSTTKELERRIEAIARWAAPDRDMAKVQAAIRSWAEQHPVRLTFATRDSIEQYVATVQQTEELSAFAVVGLMSDDVGGLVARMDFLPVMVPNQATWQAELAYLDLVQPRVDVALRSGGEALARVDRMMAWLPQEGLDRFVKLQREEIVSALAAETVEIEKVMDRQRRGAQAFLEAERLALLEQVRQERIAAMADVQRYTDHATAEATRQAKEIVDHALVRVAVILGALLVLAVVAALLLRRRSPGRPTPG